jgi:hypothetical protein
MRRTPVNRLIPPGDAADVKQRESRAINSLTLDHRGPIIGAAELHPAGSQHVATP